MSPNPSPPGRPEPLDRLKDAHPVRAGLVGESAVTRRLLRRIRRLARADLPVLVRGEIGAGKVNVARALHLNSAHSGGPLVIEVGAAFRDPLAARLLFGHQRGAFTGAITSVPGLLDEANGGTFFLDEIADAPLEAQAWLCRAFSGLEYRPLGAVRARRSRFRLVTSTSHDLRALVSTGRFRRDLYFRIRGAVVDVPPLRQRTGDLPEIAARILEEDARRRQVPPRRLSEAGRRALLEYAWPGNVRELTHELLQAAALCDDDEPIGPDRFQFVAEPPPDDPPPPARSAPLRRALGEVERRAIDEALRLAGGNKAEAARRLGMTRRTLYRRLAAMGEAERAP